MLLATNFSILLGGISPLIPNWNQRDKVLNEKQVILYIPIEGQATLKLGGNNVDILAENVYLINGNIVHDHSFREKFRHFWLHFIPVPLCLRYMLLWEFSYQSWHVSELPHTDELLKGMFELQEKSDLLKKHNNCLVFDASDSYRMKLQAYLSFLIGDIIERHDLKISDKNKRVLDEIAPAIDYMDKNYISNPLLSEVAKQVFLTPTNLHKIFCNCFSITPHRYMLQKRLFDAKQLLLNSTMPIKMIARKVGYDDSYYFSKVFKKEYGVSPKKYRQTDFY